MSNVNKLIEELENRELSLDKRTTNALELGEIGDMKAFKPLVYFLKNSKNDFLRMDCATALGYLGSEKAVSHLIRCISEEESANVRNEACEALGKIGDEKAIDALIEFMKKEEWDVARATAAISLAEIGNKKIIPEILNCLSKEKEYYVKRDMLRALLKIRDESTLNLTTKILLEDTNWEVRIEAAKNLGYFCSKQGIEALIKHLKLDPHLEVKNQCENSLIRIAGDNFLKWESSEKLYNRLKEKGFEFD